MANLDKAAFKFKATVKMKKAWTDKFATYPTVDMVLEALADDIQNGNIDDIFEVTIEEEQGGSENEPK